MEVAQATYEQIKLLQEENRRLRAALAPQVVFPRAWALFLAEQHILSALLEREGVVTRAALMTAASSESDEDDVITVHVCRLRKKLQPLGVRIITHRGHGYELTPKSRDIIRKAIAR